MYPISEQHCLHLCALLLAANLGYVYLLFVRPYPLSIPVRCPTDAYQDMSTL